MRVGELQILVIGVLPLPNFGPSVTFQALMRSTFLERIDVFKTLAAQRDRSAGEQRIATSESPTEGGCPDVLACGKRE